MTNEKLTTTTTKTHKPAGTVCVRCGADKGAESSCNTTYKKYEHHFYNKVGMILTEVTHKYLEKSL